MKKADGFPITVAFLAAILFLIVLPFPWIAPLGDTTNTFVSENSDKESLMVGFDIRGKVLSVLPATDGTVTIRVQVSGTPVIFIAELPEAVAPHLGQIIMLEGVVKIDEGEATDELRVVNVFRWSTAD